MSCKLALLFFARAARPLMLALLMVCLSGCYTRQIEGIQKDLDSLDRKVHSLNQKSNTAQPAKGTVSQSTFIQLEDRLNETILKNSDLEEEVNGLRQNYADLKTGSGSAVSGVSDKGKLGSIEKQVSENTRKTQAMQREMDGLKTTFESMRNETKSLIQLLKEEFGDGATEPAASADHAAATTLEDPPTATEKSAPQVSVVEPVSAPPPSQEETVQVANAVPRSYIIKAGDSLSSIAKKFGVSQQELRRANNLKDGDNIKMGYTLQIPQ